MRIAIAADGTRGDVHPMLALGRSLAARGHELRICAPPDFAPDVAAHGLVHRPVGRDVREFLRSQAAAMHAGAWAVAREGERYFRENGERHFRELPEAMEGAELVLAAGTQVAASSIAEALRARYHYVAYCPVLFPSASYPPAFVSHQGLPPWCNRLLWRAATRFFQRSLGGMVDAGRRSLGLPPCRDVMALTSGEAPWLAAEPLLAPPPGDTPVPLRPIGCLHPLEEGPLPGKLEAFLAADEPPVYLGFGSMPDPDPVRTTRVLLDAVERSGVRAVIAEGWAGLGRSPLPERVTVVGPVPHATLFRRVAAVVHHGGAGTTTAAACAGTPQLVVPHVLDQFWWARRVAELGVSVPALSRRKLDAETLAERLRSLRDNELLAARAAELGERLRAARRERPDPADLVA